jgi:DNA-binding transcriptional ArsR family regulator
VSAVFDALAAPRRREILRLVWDQERSAGEIHRAVAEVSFGAVSQHLRILEAAGLVARRPQGRHQFYAARKDLGLLGRWLVSTWEHALDGLKAEAEAEEARSKNRRTRRRPRPRR